MYCIRCGKQINDGVKYCMFCGAPTEEGKKAQARPEPDTTSIPTDFFSRRMQEEQGDFTIAIPRDFIQKPSAQQTEPDPAGEMEYTQMVSRQDIADAMRKLPEEDILPPQSLQEELADAIDTQQSIETKEQPQEIESLEYSRVMSKEEARQAAKLGYATEEKTEETEQQPQEMQSLEYSGEMSKEEIQEAAAEPGDMTKEQSEESVDDIENEDFTRVIPKPEIQAAEQAEMPSEQEESLADVTDIPDIPIPDDFVAPQPIQEERIHPNPDAAYRRNQIHYRAQPEEEETDEEDGPEQLISVRGIILVAMIVIVLFAIAVGAFIMALQGGEPAPAGSGSGNTGVSFSYGEDAD